MTVARISVKWAATVIFAATTVYSAAAFADNPLVQTSYTADPAPMVYEGRLYLFTSHDEDVTVNNFFTMNDWRLYSTVDMVNWTDHGSPASYKTFSWGTGDAWAIQVVARNGKFYLYAPINNSTGSKIGVAVAQKPEGPYTDPLGKALISTGSGNIDPTVFTDDDGQAYLYWGNPDLYNVKLNADMTSFPGSPTKVNLSTAGFGVRTKTDRATAYEEGPWFYKRSALYYIVYPADSTPEKISYTTSSSPLGPWTYRGDIMAKETGSGGSFTNHPGVVDFKGHSYFFYHNAALPGGGGYKRSVCVEEFSYNADGTIPTLTISTAGPKAVENLNPFQRVEAETIAFSSGLKTEVCSAGGMDVTSINNGDYIKVKNVNFGSGATSFDARVATAISGGSIGLYLDSQTGTLLGTCAVSGTGGAQTWMTKTCTVTGATGVHDLFLKFIGGSGNLFSFDWWQFSGPGGMDTGSGGAGNGGASGQGGKPEAGGVGIAAGPAIGDTGGSATSSAGASPSTGESGSGAASSGGQASSGGSAGTTTGGHAPSDEKPVDSSSGCSCRSSAARGGSTPALALCALLAVVLRRRREQACSASCSRPRPNHRRPTSTWTTARKKKDAPSGYGTLGVSGGEGKMLKGDASAIVNVATSIDRNLNGCGYCLISGSPATDDNFTPDASAPNWDYRVVYEVWIDFSVFKGQGFGGAFIPSVHASPSMAGDNTIVVEPNPCPPDWDTPYCPPSVIEEGGNCFSAPPTDGSCPEGTVPDIKNEGQSCVPSNY